MFNSSQFILFIYIICFSFRLFCFEIYFIPSSSMANTLYPKDIIVVNKLKYGPRLPKYILETPLLRIFFNKRDRSNGISKQNNGKLKRLPGISSINRGDIVVFENSKVIVKRCVAIAGDTLKIVNGKVYINDSVERFSNNIKNNYTLRINNPLIFYKALDSLKIESNILSVNRNKWKQLNLSNIEVVHVNKLRCIDSLELKLMDFSVNTNLFPWAKDHPWTLDNYGPIVLPKKGMEIQLNDDTFQFYGYTLKKHEKVEIYKENGLFYKEGKLLETYTFRRNYLFMLGDNRKESMDSRYIGFVPEENVIGEVSCVLFSTKDQHFQWSRFFKKVE
ncbi:signal peptidase I [Aestuariibaculum sp. TT11]|uniref:Signal peptidase I n=1 Tax=Aestuariibaculum sediminum TaxID=2770637 RepID=A0A8J6QAQ0_9FLAO|nr:signal peptidase I [Aestuariibaculum sediminum]